MIEPIATSGRLVCASEDIANSIAVDASRIGLPKLDKGVFLEFGNRELGESSSRRHIVGRGFLVAEAEQFDRHVLSPNADAQTLHGVAVVVDQVETPLPAASLQPREDHFTSVNAN